MKLFACLLVVCTYLLATDDYACFALFMIPLAIPALTLAAKLLIASAKIY
jgi:hypothetical protein